MPVQSVSVYCYKSILPTHNILQSFAFSVSLSARSPKKYMYTLRKGKINTCPNRTVCRYADKRSSNGESDPITEICNHYTEMTREAKCSLQHCHTMNTLILEHDKDILGLRADKDTENAKDCKILCDGNIHKHQPPSTKKKEGIHAGAKCFSLLLQIHFANMYSIVRRRIALHLSAFHIDSLHSNSQLYTM